MLMSITEIARAGTGRAVGLIIDRGAGVNELLGLFLHAAAICYQAK